MSLAFPTISGILNGLAYQFVKPHTRKEGKGQARMKHAIGQGANTAIANYIGINYLYPYGSIAAFFNRLGSQGMNVFLSIFASATQILAHTYITKGIPKGSFLTNFLYNLGSDIIAQYAISYNVLPISA